MSQHPDITKGILEVAERRMRWERDRKAVKVALHNAMRAFPNQRMTQLIQNALSFAGHHDFRDPFNVEDGDMARMLQDYVDKVMTVEG